MKPEITIASVIIGKVRFIPITELEEAKNIARRLLRERDEATLLLTDCQDRVDRYFAKITSLKSHVSKVEAERDALAKQCDELRGVLEQHDIVV